MIAQAAGIGMALIASEHFFSTFLSSPWTTEKFVETEEDRRKVRELYLLAIAASFVTAALLATILNDSYPIIAVIILSLMYVVVYERAMGKGI